MGDEVPTVSFVGEMPLPATNLFILAEMYVLEQWLRRVALASLMAKGGSRWPSLIPEDVLSDAKRQVSLLKRRTFLDPENSDNLVWALTVDQLRVLLCDDDLSPFVFELTGLSRRELDHQLVKLREIRNIVAHNRATNDVALQNFRLVKDCLDRAIRAFKLTMLYPLWQATSVVEHQALDSAGAIQEFFDESGLAEGRVFILLDLGRFYEFSVVAGDPLLINIDDYVDAGRLLDAFDDIRHAVLAIVLPIPSHGGEMAVLWPKDVTRAEQESIRDRCLEIQADTDVPFEEQDPKYICDPLIWPRGRSCRWQQRSSGVPRSVGTPT